MEIPFHYQVSEYDCVPTTFINAIAYLFDRESIPPLVLRHIFAYSMDTVSRGGRLGRAGTSGYAIQLLGNWIACYKTRKFSVQTEYLQGEEVHAGDGSPIVAALDDGGVALCNISLARGEWHFVLALRREGEWIEVFDPYLRRSLRNLHDQVQLLPTDSGRDPNLAIRRSWLDRKDNSRFTLGEAGGRECLLMWRVR